MENNAGLAGASQGANRLRARGRARKVVQDVAEDLLRIYSLREARPGIAFAPDTAEALTTRPSWSIMTLTTTTP